MAAPAERGFFYRTTDPIQNLLLRIRARQVHSRSASELSSELLTKTLKWQDKHFAPWELTKYCQICEAHPDGGFGDVKSRREREYIERIRNDPQNDITAVREECLAELEKNGLYIYTYVDQDDFVPGYERSEKKTTSEIEDTPIAECMTNLPDRFATLSSAGEDVQQRVTREGNFQVGIM